LTLFKIFIQHRLTGWFEEGFKQAMQMCVHWYQSVGKRFVVFR
jgi:hypothetical protein